LDRIEAIGWRVHTRRARTTDLEKLLRMPGILAQVQRLQAPRCAPRFTTPD
jgi:hypothetical protein